MAADDARTSSWRHRVVRTWHRLSRPATGDQPPEPAAPPRVPADLVPLLTDLGGRLLESGQATNDVEQTLSAVAAANGPIDLSVMVLPTGILVQVLVADGYQTQFSLAGPATLRLDQVGALDHLSRALVDGTATLSDGRRELARIAAQPPRFGPLVTVVGHTVLTLGFGLSLNPTVRALPAYVGLGALVGLLRLVTRRYPALMTAMPVIAAFLVTVLSVQVLTDLVGETSISLLAPPLVSFLPGALLTTATIELTHQQVVSGASRLVYGLAQLALLAFGVVAGLATAGQATAGTPGPALGGWAPWVGVALVALGDLWYSSAPRGSLPWIAVALYVAYGAQAFGSVILDPRLSGFVGGLVVVPVSRLIARAPHGPSPTVTALPVFWLLVPGALGFIGVSEIATGAGGTQEVVDTGLSLVSISLGVLAGTGLTREASALQHSIQRR